VIVIWLLACKETGGHTAEPGADSPVDSEESAAPTDTPTESGGGDSDPTDTDTALPSDLDADGWSVAEGDCDDTDPSIHPDARETWYDGVDQNCAGDDDFDADGDGVYPPEHGGSDCNDDHDFVYPGAEEWCDEIDHDCDGDTLNDGVCGKAQDLLAVHAVAIHGESTDYYFAGQEAGFVGDLDGDGAEEILAGCMWCRWPDGTEEVSLASLLPGGLTGRTNYRTDVQRTAFGTGYASHWFMAFDPQPLGDWNGDGSPDVVLVSPYAWDTYDNEVIIVAGPMSAWGEGVDVDEEALAKWSSWDDAYFAQEHVVADFDLDGLSDIVLGTPGFKDGQDSALQILWGSDVTSGSFQYTDIESRLELEAGKGWLGARMAAGGDADGDGQADLLASQSHESEVFLVYGADLTDVTATVDVRDVAAASWEFTADECLAWMGDLDSDGYDDWVMGVPGFVDYEYQGVVYFVTASEVVADSGLGRDPTLLQNSWIGAGESAHLASSCVAGDFDGSGADDLAVVRWDPDIARRYVRVVPSTNLLTGPRAPLPDGLEYYSSDEDRLDPRYLHDSGDFDGDGDDEILFWGDLAREGISSIAILDGWDIPWEDESAW